MERLTTPALRGNSMSLSNRNWWGIYWRTSLQYCCGVP